MLLFCLFSFLMLDWLTDLLGTIVQINKNGSKNIGDIDSGYGELTSRPV